MPEGLDRIGDAMADRYAVEREIGSGGMASVYLAADLKYGRQVAVKVLRPELAAAVGSDRFLREIQVTAGLNHPHILPLLDSGEAGSFLYYVMPYVAGGSLRRRLSRDCQLPLDVVLRITQQVASALDHAHRYGVIHRDVKPENILFSEAIAVVADFGIAKAVGAAGPEALTRTGVPLGTPGYMSPEQAAGAASFDARTDVYGLAAVVYEMLIGEKPGMWPTEEALRLGRFVDATPEHRERLDNLPGRVEQVLVRGLAVRPVDRFATPLDLADALAAAGARGAKLSDSQVRAILARAAELEAGQPTPGGALSIGAVEQVAAEVGLPPALVREAARELDRAAAPAAEPDDKLVSVDQTAVGAVPESALEALVDEIQATLGAVGHVSRLGKTLTWTPAAPGPEGRRVIVTIAGQTESTRIHVEERLELSGWRQLATIVSGVGGAGLGALLGLAMSGGDPSAAILIPIALGTFMGHFAVYHALIRNLKELRRPQLEQLAERLAALAERAGG